MKTGWVLTQEDFDRLLRWLDANLEAAGKEYEAIRQRLIKIFARRGCSEAEDLADETINRVTETGNYSRRLPWQPAVLFLQSCSIGPHGIFKEAQAAGIRLRRILIQRRERA